MTPTHHTDRVRTDREGRRMRKSVAGLATALILPIGAVYWAILERTRWSNFVLAAVGVTALVMAARMNQIWY